MYLVFFFKLSHFLSQVYFKRKLHITMLDEKQNPVQAALVLKNPPAKAGDLRDAGSIPGLGRSPGGGHGNPLQRSCLGSPMDRGAGQATVHRVTESNMTEVGRD